MQKHFKKILFGLCGSIGLVLILFIMLLTMEWRPYWIKYVARETILTDRVEYGIQEKRKVIKKQTSNNKHLSAPKIIRETNLGPPMPKNDSDWSFKIPKILHQKWLTQYVPRMTIPWISSWNKVGHYVHLIARVLIYLNLVE